MWSKGKGVFSTPFIFLQPLGFNIGGRGVKDAKKVSKRTNISQCFDYMRKLVLVTLAQLLHIRELKILAGVLLAVISTAVVPFTLIYSAFAYAPFVSAIIVYGITLVVLLSPVYNEWTRWQRTKARYKL